MGGNRISQGGQYGRGQESSTTTHYMFAECRYQISPFCNEERFRSLDQALLMCEMVDPYNSRSERVTWATYIK